MALASGFAATSSPTTWTPSDASTKSVCGSGHRVPSTSCRSGVSVCPGPGPDPSTLHTFWIDRFQNSVDATPSGLSFIRWPSMTTDPPSAARSIQSFGFGMFASTRALKSCSPTAA